MKLDVKRGVERIAEIDDRDVVDLAHRADRQGGSEDALVEVGLGTWTITSLPGSARRLHLGR